MEERLGAARADWEAVIVVAEGLQEAVEMVAARADWKAVPLVDLTAGGKAAA